MESDRTITVKNILKIEDKMKNEKCGLLIASFGTSFSDTEKKCIKPIEEAARQLFPDYEVRRAFTSLRIIDKLASKGINVPTPEEAVRRYAEEGFTHLIVQPLHFMKGHEYDKKIVAPLKAYRERFEGFAIGEPLLSSPGDLEEMIDHISRLSQEVRGEAILFMGHGTDHPSDSVYSTLQDQIDGKGINVHIGTVEGRITLEEIKERLLQRKIKKVHLYPLMLVAGDHARNDMAGEEDSWKSELESMGIEAEVHLEGMGEFMKIRRLFISHIRACKKQLFPDIYRRMRESDKEKAAGRTVPRESIQWYPTVESDSCEGCGLCYLLCHREVYDFSDKDGKVSVINPYNCVVNCSYCSTFCPTEAIVFPHERIRE